MTRYFLFEFDTYYPSGAFQDLTGVFESEDDALDVLKNKRSWEDIVEIHSLENGGEPQLLYSQFAVRDGHYLQYVIGDKEQRTIKIMGKERWKYTAIAWHKYAKIDDFKMEVE